MAGVEILAWLVLAFADGPDCLVQASVQWRPDGPAWVRDDGCAVRCPMGRHQNSHGSALDLVPVGPRRGIYQRESRNGAVRLYGRQADQPINESGPIGHARQMENRHFSHLSKTTSQYDPSSHLVGPTNRTIHRFVPPENTTAVFNLVPRLKELL